MMMNATTQTVTDRAALRMQQRIERQAQREERRRHEVRCRWNERLAETQTLVPEALAQWESKPLQARQLWLVLAVFETTEADGRKGTSGSPKTKWFDGIAPRARDPNWHGVSGFTVRVGAQVSSYLKLSHNGYVYLTDLGMALVQMLRERFPEIHPDAPDVRSHRPLDVPGLMEIPAPRWRGWK